MSEFFSKNPYDSLDESHPVRIYLKEAEYIRELISQIKLVDVVKESKKFLELFEKFCTIEKHFARKENQLFPYLEKYGWTSPSQNMWAMHDNIRDDIREIRALLKEKNLVSVEEILPVVFRTVEHLLQVEEVRLLPNALNLLDKDDWLEMREGDNEIGFMIEVEQEYLHPSLDTKRRKLPFSLDGRIELDEGYMLPEQINLMLQFMPVDITYVDENDVVIFYNRGDKRVFPRSAGIIGREVKFCHPPKSVDQVLLILKEFKAGRRDEAEFWIEFKGRFIHIRYFAIRNKEGEYKGVIEVSQDVTEIRELKGERRLLDWE